MEKIQRMIGFRSVEMWGWLGRDVWAGSGRFGRECVKDDMKLLGLQPE